MYLAKPVPLVRRRDIFEVAERTLADGTIEQPLDAAALDRVAGAGRRRRLRVGRRLPAARLRHARAREGHRRARSPAPSVRIAPSRSPRTSRPSSASTSAPARWSPTPTSSRSSAATSAASTGALKQRGHHVRPLHHAVERRPRVAGARLRHADPHRRVRARRRRAAVRRDRPRGRPRPRAHLRHGRHHGQARRHRRRRARHHADLRGRPGALPQGQRPAHQRPGRRAAGDRRRRRQHRRAPTWGSSRSARRAPAPIRAPSATAAAASSPTVTDANVVLGYINPDYFNGGAMRARRARPPPTPSRERIGKPLGLDAGEAAWGIHSHRQRQHGAGHAHRLRGAGARSAQVCARGLRRRRPAACGAARARARHPARHRPVRRRRRLGHRHAGGQLQARCLDDAPAAPRRRRRDRDRGHLPPARDARARRSCRA